MKYAIKLVRSERYIVDAPPTGFRSTPHLKKAMLLGSLEGVKAYVADRGIFTYDIVEVPDKPVLPKVGDKITCHEGRDGGTVTRIHKKGIGYGTGAYVSFRRDSKPADHAMAFGGCEVRDIDKA